MIDIKGFVDEFRRRFGGAEPEVFSAPGRVNLIGEHTDYNEGFVLPLAIDRRTYVACTPRTDGRIRAVTLTLDKEAEFGVDDAKTADKDWTVYIRGMLAVLREKGITIDGADLLIDTDIPFGAGLSSSAAFEVAVGLAMSSMAGREMVPLDLALAGQRVEHEFIGLRSGIMDQLVSASAREGNALLIDCRSLETRAIPLDLGDMVLVACDSRVKHELASSAYNDRRAECEQGVELLAKTRPGIASLRDVTTEDLVEHEAELPPVAFKRCRHVVTENVRVIEAVSALEHGDLAALGRLLYLSHESLRDDYEVSCPELDLLVDEASSVPGVLGSRMTGGGFGGCTITLMEDDVLERFQERVDAAYSAEFGRSPDIFVVKASAGAGREELAG